MATIFRTTSSPTWRRKSLTPTFRDRLLIDGFALQRLLALFGERVTTQFMSQALGWADNIILAMGPLGIMTIIVSAIRVGGPVWLRAVIGRARENRAAAEGELMSSTSNEVCELWNGQKVVRVAGEAPIAEFICLLPQTRGTKDDASVINGVVPESPVINGGLVPGAPVINGAPDPSSVSKDAPLGSRPVSAPGVHPTLANLDEDPFEVVSLKEAVEKKYLRDVSQGEMASPNLGRLFANRCVQKTPQASRQPAAL